jgi:hypothetical protein
MDRYLLHIQDQQYRDHRQYHQASIQCFAEPSERTTGRPLCIGDHDLGYGPTDKPDEGAKAFTRLQLEEMKIITDQSLFAWTWAFDIFVQERGGDLPVLQMNLKTAA